MIVWMDDNCFLISFYIYDSKQAQFFSLFFYKIGNEYFFSIC